jgi:uncharacterized protein
MITQARAARPSIVMNGKDYYSALAPYLLNLQYSDNCDGEKADDLQLQLADRDKRFISDWTPQIGAFIDVSIIVERWFAPNAAPLSLDCGRFWIDSLDFDLPAHTVSVKATSIPTSAHLKANDEIRGWENSSLKDIVTQISTENNLDAPDWQADINPRYSRVEQTEESALSFLKKRATDSKLSIKVHRNKIVVFDEQKMEAAAPKFCLVYGSTSPDAGLPFYRLEGAQFSLKVTDTQKKATVSHLNPDTGLNDTGTFDADSTSPSRSQLLRTAPVDTDSTPTWHQHVTINPEEQGDGGEGDGEGGDGGNGGGDGGLRALDPTQPLDYNNPSSAGASRRAKAEVRKANKERETATIAMGIGNPLIAAGMTFTLKGVGQFDGKWFVQSAEHTVGEVYDTKLTVRRCLEGY